MKELLPFFSFLSLFLWKRNERFGFFISPTCSRGKGVKDSAVTQCFAWRYPVWLGYFYALILVFFCHPKKNHITRAGQSVDWSHVPKSDSNGTLKWDQQHFCLQPSINRVSVKSATLTIFPDERVKIVVQLNITDIEAPFQHFYLINNDAFTIPT